MRLGAFEIQSAYFIGIAGIGMSALARHFRHHGVTVSGYDRDRSDLARELESEGIPVHYTEDVRQVPASPDLVVYTPAVPQSHAGLRHFRQLEVRVMKRSEVLGMISASMRCIAVAGTHGKTTTASMLAYLLRAGGVDCTAFLGGLAVDFDGNYAHGSSEWMVAEADEYDRSFLKLSPEIAVITSMDADHLDVYGSVQSMTKAFAEFALRVRPGGVLVLHERIVSTLENALGDEGLGELAQRAVRVLTYGSAAEHDGSKVNVVLLRSAPEGRGVRFTVQTEDAAYEATCPVPGRHNVLNAVGALTVCHVLDSTVPGLMAKAVQHLGGFRGIQRRFEYVYEGGGLVIINDYAHHPEELRAAIKAAREQFAGKRITGVFQPHLYSRTADFYKEFAEALSQLDTAILVELYPAREQPMEGVSSELIYDHLTVGDRHCTTKEDLIDLLVSKRPEVLLLLGAGDLDREIPAIVNALRE